MLDAAGRTKRRRAWIVIPVLIGALLITAALWGLSINQAAPSQPFPFNHSIHAQKGIECIYCHSAAARSSSAGLPSRALCLGCHNNIKSGTASLRQFADFAKTNLEFVWVPVALMPDFVYFSHQPHLAAGLDCSTCHGEVSRMAEAQPQPKMNMGWCLDCHKKMAPDQAIKLFDCATCHK